jgi:type II secretory pathway pseudopilin PulG
MFWLRANGIIGIETLVLFTIVGILTFTAVPYYASLTNRAHDAKVKAMHSMINASVIGASADSVIVGGSKSVPNPSQLTLQDDYSLEIIYKD